MIVVALIFRNNKKYTKTLIYHSSFSYTNETYKTCPLSLLTFFSCPFWCNFSPLHHFTKKGQMRVLKCVIQGIRQELSFPYLRTPVVCLEPIE